MQLNRLVSKLVIISMIIYVEKNEQRILEGLEEAFLLTCSHNAKPTTVS